MWNLFNLLRRPGKALQQAASPAVLNHAWRLLHNDPGCWVRGLPVDEMERNVIRHVGELSRELLSGRYRPQPMRCYEIAKADGGKRLICAPAVRDKLAQRAVLTILEPLGEAVFHESSFGYRPQCSREMALARLREGVRRGWVWIGDADIRACFDTIPNRGVLKELKRLCPERALLRLVRLWLDSLPDRFRPAGPGRGLPQGMVLSPFLCNLYLHRLDCALDRQGIPFVRFADDFVLLGKTENEAQKALRFADKQLHQLGLELHPDKTRVLRATPRHSFLGLRLPDSKERFQP
jgi:RNA-directed DNA polymerase